MVRLLCRSSILVSEKNKNWPDDFENMVDDGSFSHSDVKLRDFSKHQFYGVFLVMVLFLRLPLNM